MDLSVIISTYNQPAWLEKVLWGYSCQDDRGFELIVADDGSGEETQELVSTVASRSDFPIRHIWHEDRGYRRSDILNAAILASTGGYLVFSDGDCIPRHDFVGTHRELAEPGRFLSGGSIDLSRSVSQAISREDVASGRFADARWLRARGQDLGRHVLRLLPPGIRPRALDRMTTTRATWNLNNASTWREHIFAVNGMESEMQYGGADRALGSRLENLGLRGKQIRFRAVLLHLHHSRPYKTRESIERNKAIRRRIVEEGETQAREGLMELKARWSEGDFLEFTPGSSRGETPRLESPLSPEGEGPVPGEDRRSRSVGRSELRDSSRFPEGRSP